MCRNDVHLKGRAEELSSIFFWFGILEWRCASAIQIVPRENSRLTRSPNSNQLFAEIVGSLTDYSRPLAVQVSSFSGNCVAKFSKILPQSANPRPTASILFFEGTEKSLNRGHHPAF